jgi:hypothetical protein
MPNNDDSEYIRGSFISSRTTVVEEMGRLLPLGDNGVFWGGLQIPTIEAVRHFCIMGTVGSGKTVLIRLLMQSVLWRIDSATGDKAANLANQDRFFVRYKKDHPLIDALEKKLVNYYDDKFAEAQRLEQIEEGPKKIAEEKWRPYINKK